MDDNDYFVGRLLVTNGGYKLTGAGCRLPSLWPKIADSGRLRLNSNFASQD